VSERRTGWTDVDERRPRIPVPYEHQRVAFELRHVTSHSTRPLARFNPPHRWGRDFGRLATVELWPPATIPIRYARVLPNRYMLCPWDQHQPLKSARRFDWHANPRG